MGREVSSQALYIPAMVQPVSRGGTGSNQATGAAATLNLVTTAMKDVDNGVFSLNAQGKMSGDKFPNSNGLNKVNVNGALTAYVSTTIQLLITDYDSFRAWTVSVSAGSFTRNGDTISFTAPATAQTVNLTINGRVIAITVALPAPQVPTITVPANGAVNQATTSVSATASAFVALGDASTHTSSDWQLASDAGFSTIVLQSLNDAVNKTTWNPSVTLSVNTTYYLRVRYKGSNGNSSAYSSVNSFTTKTVTEATVETAIIVSDFPASSAGFGYGVSVSEDGNRIIVTGAQNTANFGQTGYTMRYYAFHKVSGSWTKVWFLNGSADYPSGLSGSSGYYYTNSSKISPDGLRMFLMEPDNGNGQTFGGNEMYMDGRISIYLWNGTTYALETTLTDPNGASQYGFFGAMLMVNQDATRLVTCTPFNNVHPAIMIVYKRVGTAWSLVATTGVRRNVNNPFYIQSVAISKDGTRAMMTYYNPNATNINTTFVWASVYTVTASAVTFEADLSIAIGATSQCPGRSCAMNADGSYIAIGSLNGGSSDQNALAVKTGSVYVFSRSGTTWTQQARLINDDVTVTEYFGQELYFNDAGDRLLISAYLNNYNSQTNRGAYYLFSRASTTWTRVTAVSGSTSIASAQFAGSFGANAGLTTAVARGWPSAGGNQVLYVFN